MDGLKMDWESVWRVRGAWAGWGKKKKIRRMSSY